MSLKAYIKNKAKEKHISSQLVMQNYMLERLLERISLSKYKNNFILKGGFLISAIVGIDSRTTMDLDTTIKGIDLDKEVLNNVLNEVCTIDLSDNIKFEVLGLEDIREKDDYPGIRVKINGLYPPLKVPLSVDMTTGDKITPREINYSFTSLFEDKKINVLAYNLETILAEKIETILSRSIANTRARDFYDIYILHKLYVDKINPTDLKNAITATLEKRNTLYLLDDYKTILEKISKDSGIADLWDRYKKTFDYTSEASLTESLEIVQELISKILST
ncbi:MAG: nucleotidyl transferase AbiEii/AbiGii toxin family protein [Clostridia bacterium]|nr:nucleotidyl transferase AbiEii/AbiGii toxin family protein [Clostridia bacterium]